MGLYTIGLVNFSGCGESSAGGRGGFFDNEAFFESGFFGWSAMPGIFGRRGR